MAAKSRTHKTAVPGIQSASEPTDDVGTAEQAAPVEPAAESAAAPTKKPKSAKSSANPNDLPDQDDIDPTTIDRAVLSKQGWVVPHKGG